MAVNLTPWKALALATCWLPASFVAHSSDERIKTVHDWLELPRAIGGLEYTGEHVYEDPALGRSWGYRRGGLTLTVYVFDQGEPDVEEGPESRRVLAEYETSKGNVLARSDASTKLLREGEVSLGVGEAALKAHEALFEITHQKHTGSSYLWITSVNGQFVKVRFSALNVLATDLHLTRSEILDALGSSIVRKPRQASAAKAGAQEKKREYRMLLAGDMPPDEMMYWITYAGGRAAWRSEHVADEAVANGPVVPGFEEEVWAHDFVWMMLEDPAAYPRRSPLRGMHRAREAGFLREYVWTYLRQPGWQEPAGLRIAEFDVWRRKQLKKHTAAVHAGIEYEGPGADKTP
jgi:hypothetical protein